MEDPDGVLDYEEESKNTAEEPELEEYDEFEDEEELPDVTVVMGSNNTAEVFCDIHNTAQRTSRDTQQLFLTVS